MINTLPPAYTREDTLALATGRSPNRLPPSPFDYIDDLRTIVQIPTTPRRKHERLSICCGRSFSLLVVFVLITFGIAGIVASIYYVCGYELGRCAW